MIHPKEAFAQTICSSSSCLLNKKSRARATKAASQDKLDKRLPIIPEIVSSLIRDDLDHEERVTSREKSITNMSRDVRANHTVTRRHASHSHYTGNLGSRRFPLCCKLHSRSYDNPTRGQKLSTDLFFSNFSGTAGISRQNPGISRPESLVCLVSRDILDFLATTPSCGRSPPHRKISGPKNFGLCSFFLPDRHQWFKDNFLYCIMPVISDSLAST